MAIVVPSTKIPAAEPHPMRVGKGEGRSDSKNKNSKTKG